MKWYRSETNKKLGGVCGGIAELYDWDVTVVRIVVFALLFTPVPVIIAYFAAWFIIPKKGELDVINNDSSIPTTRPTRTKRNQKLSSR
jgi:phage shock protein C